MPSLPLNLMTVFACPTDVFDDLLAKPPRAATWLTPMALVCVAGVFCEIVIGGFDQVTTGGGAILGAVREASAQPGMLAKARVGQLAAIGGSTVLGTFWSALVLWLIGRVWLKVRFSFLKTVEIVAVAGMVLALGMVVTGLLALALADPTARPAMSLLVTKSQVAAPLRAVLETLNVFHLWTTALLAIGLSRLGGTSFAESAFWVFGYWIVARLGFILLA